MRVDRSRFLMLTAAIAATTAACDRIKSNLTGAEPGQAAADPAPGGQGPSGGVPQPAGAPGLAGKTGAAAHPKAGAPVAPAVEGAGTSPTADPAGATAAGWGVVSCAADNAGAPGDCSTLKGPDPAGGGYGGGGYGGGGGAVAACDGLARAKASCDRFKGELKPRIAEKAVGCLLASSGQKAICNPPDPAPACLQNAVNNACVEPASVDACSKIAGGCGWASPGIDTCQHELSSVETHAQRAKLIACMTEGCDAKACLQTL
jgi:hypothetical protein